MSHWCFNASPKWALLLLYLPSYTVTQKNGQVPAKNGLGAYEWQIIIENEILYPSHRSRWGSTWFHLLQLLYMSSGQKKMLNLMPCTNYGGPLSLVKISVLPEVSQTGYRYRVVPYRLWRFCATSEKPRRSKTKLVYTIILSVTHLVLSCNIM